MLKKVDFGDLAMNLMLGAGQVDLRINLKCRALGPVKQVITGAEQAHLTKTPSCAIVVM
jgi:hypothetical protein